MSVVTQAFLGAPVVPDIANKVLMIEEADFHIKGDRNMQNYYYWGTQNSMSKHFMLEYEDDKVVREKITKKNDLRTNIHNWLK